MTLEEIAAKYTTQNFSEGKSQLSDVAEKHRIKPAGKVAGFGSNPEDYNPTNGMSGTDKFLAGAGKAMTDLGRGASQLFGAGNQAEIDAAKQRDKALMDTGAGMAGNIAGSAAMALPTAMIPGANTYTGAALLGAGMGAMQPVASGESRAENVGYGAGGGLLGQGVANAVGRVFKPVQSELPKTLSELAGKAETMGIPLNPAQKTGSKPLQTINAVLDNLPFTAGRQDADKAVQRAAFNRAVLSTAGENADVATPDVLNAARNRIGTQFNDLSARNNVALGNDFLTALSTVEQGTNAFTKPGVRDAVDKALELASSGSISGRTYQNVRSTLGKQAKDAMNSGNSEVGQALKTIQSALDDAATNSIAPADKAAWNEARKQWGALKAIEKAAAPTSADAVAGNVSPAKLSQAVMQGNKNSLLYGSGDQTLPDLARIGQAFIKDQVPNSGTAQRMFYQGLMTGAPGALGMLTANPLAAAGGLAAGSVTPAMVQTLMRSEAGKKYLTQGLLPSLRDKIPLGLLQSGAAGAGASGLLGYSQQ